MNFVLTQHWFDKIKSGEKTHEYRAKTIYWTKRIDKLKIGDTITFSRGYTKNRIRAKVLNIQYISAKRLSAVDQDAYDFLKHTYYAFWDIEFILQED